MNSPFPLILLALLCLIIGYWLGLHNTFNDQLNNLSHLQFTK